MTKAELIEALKDFPDDIQVKVTDRYGDWDLNIYFHQFVKLPKETYVCLKTE